MFIKLPHSLKICYGKILIVEDDPFLAENLQKLLNSEEYSVENVYYELLAEKLSLHKHYDCIVMNINLLSKNGYKSAKINYLRSKVHPYDVQTFKGFSSHFFPSDIYYFLKSRFLLPYRKLYLNNYKISKLLTPLMKALSKLSKYELAL